MDSTDAINYIARSIEWTVIPVIAGNVRYMRGTIKKYAVIIRLDVDIAVIKVYEKSLVVCQTPNEAGR